MNTWRVLVGGKHARASNANGMIVEIFLLRKKFIVPRLEQWSSYVAMSTHTHTSFSHLNGHRAQTQRHSALGRWQGAPVRFRIIPNDIVPYCRIRIIVYVCVRFLLLLRAHNAVWFDGCGAFRACVCTVHTITRKHNEKSLNRWIFPSKWRCHVSILFRLLLVGRKVCSKGWAWLSWLSSYKIMFLCAVEPRHRRRRRRRRDQNIKSKNNIIERERVFDFTEIS